nr:MAG TPA: hypothetical protein [Caudoviricetes sp.]
MYINSCPGDCSQIHQNDNGPPLYFCLTRSGGCGTIEM